MAPADRSTCPECTLTTKRARACAHAALKALYASPHTPTAAALQQLHIQVADDTKRHLLHPRHPRRTRLDVLESDIRPDQRDVLQPPCDMGRWADRGQVAALDWANRLGSSAYSIVHEAAAHNMCPHQTHDHCALPPTTVEVQHGPRPADKWQMMLFKAPWDRYMAWSPSHVFLTGVDCDGQCGDMECHCSENVVGCVLPLRPHPNHPEQTEASCIEPLHRGELSCALALVLRQLTRNHMLGHVTIVTVTPNARIRVHETSVEVPTAADASPTIHITKCLDTPIDDVTSGDAAAQGSWLNVMSYLCFTDEANLLSARADHQPGDGGAVATQEPPQDVRAHDGPAASTHCGQQPVAAKRKTALSTVDPESENIQPAAHAAAAKVPSEPPASRPSTAEAVSRTQQVGACSGWALTRSRTRGVSGMSLHGYGLGGFSRAFERCCKTIFFNALWHYLSLAHRL
ncbi:hypothetical protein PMIN06_012471 [Paraphaeosphaeria minitans]